MRCRLVAYDGPDAVANAIGYAKFYVRSHDAVISVYDGAGNVIETYEHAGEFQRVVRFPPQGTKETTNL
jgi:hypothetical protein